MIGHAVQVIDIFIAATPTATVTMSLRLCLILCCEGLHVQSLKRIANLRPDLLPEASCHVEPLDVDNEDVREAVKGLLHGASLVLFAVGAIPGTHTEVNRETVGQTDKC